MMTMTYLELNTESFDILFQLMFLIIRLFELYPSDMISIDQYTLVINR